MCELLCNEAETIALFHIDQNKCPQYINRYITKEQGFSRNIFELKKIQF